MLDENLEEMKPESTEKEKKKKSKKTVDKEGKKVLKTVKKTKKSADLKAKSDDSEPSKSSLAKKSKVTKSSKPKTIKSSSGSGKKSDSNPDENIEKKKDVKKVVKEKVSKSTSDKTEKDTKAIVEKTDEVKSKEIPAKDYKTMTLEDLVLELETLINNEPINKIKDDVEAIKSAFNSKFSTLLANKKEAFIKEGGNSIDFHFSTPYKSNYNNLMALYKRKRAQYYKQLEQQFQDNLKIRLDIIEALKSLIDDVDNTNKYSSFKALQERWHSVGPIPRSKYNDTWQTYLHHVERFYDLLHLNKDLRDLDFKHNLEEKEKLIKRAEDLANEKDIEKAFKVLQELHKIWKEEIGPVDKEVREEVWNRFSSATKVIHDKRHEAFRELKVVFDVNAKKKEEVIEKMKALKIDEYKSHSDWQRGIKEIENYRDEFFNVGRVSRKQNEVLWLKFKEVTKKFNNQKNNFYKSIKAEQLENLTKKRALLSQAKSLKDTEDLKGTVEVFKKIQADWKHIGHVPRKYSDKIWYEFKDACNYFFDRLHAAKEGGDEGQVEAFNNKKTYLDTLKKKLKDENIKPSLDDVKLYISEWKTLGYVPIGMRHIEIKFNKFLEKCLADLKLGKKELNIIKFKIQMDGYKAADNIKKIKDEQFFLMKKIDELTREMQQLKNNMSFFSNTTDANPLFDNVNKTLKKHQEDIDLFKENKCTNDNYHIYRNN